MLATDLHIYCDDGTAAAAVVVVVAMVTARGLTDGAHSVAAHDAVQIQP